jgi:hypothetical protein
MRIFTPPVIPGPDTPPEAPFEHRADRTSRARRRRTRARTAVPGSSPRARDAGIPSIYGLSRRSRTSAAWSDSRARPWRAISAPTSAFAAALGVPLHRVVLEDREYTIELLIASEWWDDGADDSRELES